MLFPLTIHQTDFRSAFSRGVSVAAHKSSPAYAALEDMRELYAEDWRFPDHPQFLGSGQPFVYHPVKEQPVQRHLALRGLTIRTPVQAEPMPEARPLPHLVAAETTTPMARSRRPWPVAVTEHDDEIGSISTMPSAHGPLAASSANRTEEPAAEPISELSAIMPGQEQARPIWLNGQIEMTGGLAFVGPDTQILVRRMVDGHAMEKGRIWVTEGKFEIQVHRPMGFLVAELVTRDGQVLGRGELDLFSLRDLSANSNKVTDLRIALRPTNDRVAMRTVPAYSSGPAATMPDAHVEIQNYASARPSREDGTFSDPSLDRDSTFVARATAPKHWPTLVIGRGGHPQDIRLFSNGLMQALIQLNLTNGTDRSEANHAAIVWGQVYKGGAPVAGAEVEMAGDYQPIYFNEAFLPDSSLHATGKNGLFAFLRVRAGVQAVRVRAGGKVFPAQVFPTEHKHVSYVELDLKTRAVSQIKTVDVLIGNRPVASRLRLVGTDSALALSGDDFVEYAMAAKTFMVEAEAGNDFEISRTTLAGTPQLAYVPMIKRDWLRALADQSKVLAMPGRGTVIGFVDHQDFSVEITGVHPADQTTILYFDHQGQPVQGPHGVAGGGFAIFNAPAGLQTVYVHPHNERRVSFAQVVVAEPEYVHVMSWSANSRSQAR